MCAHRCRLLSLYFVINCAIYGENIAVRGVVHDPDHRPLPGAQITIQGAPPFAAITVQSDDNGEFQIDNVSEGSYRITASAPGFAPEVQQVTIAAARNPVLHFQLELASVRQAIEVSGAASKLAPQASTVQTGVSLAEIAQTPGADQTNSLAMITDFTPGAYMVHDMLHMRGGHQVNWFFDGIPVVNTNIAANVAPLINPKNVADLEVERGGYSSQYGDRTYGFFNVITPSGFDRDNQAELVLSAGNFYSTDDQIDTGGHTQKLAYYASVDANRSELGLATPVPRLIHDQESGEGGFFSLLYNASAHDQFRWIASLRQDHYQVPNDPDGQASGIRDINTERDDLAGFLWTHTFPSGATFTLTPYFHFNSAHYIGGPNDTPFILDDNSRSNYAGGRATLQIEKAHHNLHAGLELWAQRDKTFFGLNPHPGAAALDQQEVHWANSDTLFLEDQYAAEPWLTFDLGVRLTHYSGLIQENAADPRLGASIRIPKLGWTLHGYYAYYYQPPPLDSLAGPSLDFAIAQGFGFIPLHGERDIQHDIGVTIPVRGWALMIDQFHTSARNFLDHDVIGDSGIFIPLTDLAAVIHGEEISVSSPRLFKKAAQLRVAYSNQIAQGIGPVTGGLLEFVPSGNFLLDHDQRNTVSSVLSLTLPEGLWATPAYQFGSGFLNGNGPAHLPPHSTFDLSIGKRFNPSWSASLNAVNIGNSRYLLDTSNTFGGTHYVNPRQIYVELRYRFRY